MSQVLNWENNMCCPETEPFPVAKADEFPKDPEDLVRMLLQIREALENEKLDDFQCIDEIIEVYHRAGCRVDYRHDFG